MSRRPLYLFPVLLLSLVLVAAGCGGQATTTTPAKDQPQTTAATTAPKTETKAQAPAAPTAAPKAATEQKTAAKAPAASPAASPAAKTAASPQAATKTRGTPEGEITYAWHTAIAPTWYDPQENAAVITPYAFQYALHDALVKHMPGQVFSPSLAESYDIAPDFMSATFKLREGIKFHNGEPVTPEDVIFTFNNYKGANASILKDKTEQVEAVDNRTVKFTFKEPFLDFLTLYGSPASGAGWIVPKAYYEQVGPDGFKQNPIGAGPYKFVSQTPGSDIVLEAFTDYWRKTPNVQKITIRSVAEESTCVAGLQTGEFDFINLVPGQLIETVQSDPKLQLAPTLAAPFWLEFPGFEDPSSPFHDPKVRQAISLALDREALSEAETGGFSPNEGNWIPEDWPGAVDMPEAQYNLEQAKQLMQEAGVAEGFDAGSITPLPPYFSLAERVAGQLGQIGISLKVNQMERGAFLEKLAEGKDAFPGGVILNISGAPGDAASRVRSFAICDGASSRTCIPEIDDRFKQYEASTDPQERERLLTEIQQYIIDNHVFVPVYRLAFINAQGPTIGNQWENIIAAVPQYVYVGPYEDVEIKQ